MSITKYIVNNLAIFFSDNSKKFYKKTPEFISYIFANWKRWIFKQNLDLTIIFAYVFYAYLFC